MNNRRRSVIIANEESGGETTVTDLYKNGVINTDFYTDFVATLKYKTTYSFSKQLTYLQVTSSSTSGGWIEPYTNTKIDLTDYDRIGVTFSANFATASRGFLNGWLAVSSITPYTDSPWDASVNFFSPDIGTSAIGDYEGYLDVSALSGEYYILFNFGRGHSTLNDYIHVTHLWLEKDAPSSVPYQELTYIESTGTQYIDTDIAQVTPTIETVVSVTTADASSWIFGGGANNRVWGVVYITDYNGTNYNVAGDTWYNWVKTNVNAINDYVKISLSNNTYTFNDSISYSVSLTGDSASKIYVGMMYNQVSSTNGAKARWKSFKIGNVRDYVPCTLTETVIDYWDNLQNPGTVGLWDNVSNKFFPNNGTGDFVAGNTV